MNGECHCTSEEYGFGRISYYPDGRKETYNEFHNSEWLAEIQTDSTITRYDEDGEVLTITEKQKDGSKITKTDSGNLLFATDKNNNIISIGEDLAKYEEDYLRQACYDLGVKSSDANITLIKFLTEPDRLQLKVDMLREKLGDKVGKTADVKTGKVTAGHRKTAKEQTEITKAIMKAKRAQKGSK